jgi:hypothetical protein
VQIIGDRGVTACSAAPHDINFSESAIEPCGRRTGQQLGVPARQKTQEDPVARAQGAGITRRSAGPISNVAAGIILRRIIRRRGESTDATMAEAALETVLRRDRIVVAAALAGLAALAWGYVLWLAADMNMGGMDMTGFRMIPAGLGIMAPANAPWRAIEFAFVFAMWAVMMVGMMAHRRRR